MTSTEEHRAPPFPVHNEPRVWLLPSGTSPLAVKLVRQIYEHGDHLTIGVRPSESSQEDARGDELRDFLREVGEQGRARIRVLTMDTKNPRQCQASVAEVVKRWGRIDILMCCDSEAVVGTVEELSISKATDALVRDQFETNFFGPVNIIKAALPQMRSQRSGHIMILSGITGHIGTPGLGSYCASNWALEGFCDSLAYEIAPFNIKMTIVQPNMEVNVLTNKITFVPTMDAYEKDHNSVPSVRGMLSRAASLPPQMSSEEVSKSVYAPLSQSGQVALVSETVFALIAIGGHENPPARHIVGFEGVASVKEKLKTVSEELEDFVEVSAAVDIAKDELGSSNGRNPENLAVKIEER